MFDPLKDTMLERYLAILRGEEQPYFIKAKADIDDLNYILMDTDELWETHDTILKNTVPNLSLKRELVERILRSCHLCECRCSIDRTRGGVGKCGIHEPRISSQFLHFGEENALIPSHTIFFSGCNFQCVFCQNWDISQGNKGRYVKPELLASIIDSKGGKNVNWVGGDPTPNLAYIIDVLGSLSEPLPQVWNSNMYLTESSMDVLAKLMDLYLTDFKYGNDDCAFELSKVHDYMRVIQRNHLLAEQTGDLIIRHLVLPSHIECCTHPILEWIDDKLTSPAVNLMTQYHPCYKADKYPGIDRLLSQQEIKEVKRLKHEYAEMVI